MGSRSTNIRTKVAALLVSLACLWAFSAWVTLRDGLNLLGVQTLNERVFEPSDPLLLQLQSERRLSAGYLGKPTPEQLATLRTERQKLDELAESFRESARSRQSRLAADDELEERIDALIERLDGLAQVRTAIDERAIDRVAAQQAFTEVLDAIFHVFDALGSLDDEEIAGDTANLIELNRARELISQQDALLTGAIAAGRLTTAEQARFAQLVGAQRFIRDRAAAELPPADQQRYREAVDGPAFNHLRSLEDRLISTPPDEGRPAVEAAEWNSAAGQAMADLREVVLAGGDDVVARSGPVAIGVIVRMLLMAGLGLLAVIVSVIVSVTTTRALVQQLQRLRDAARQLADERLPSVVNRIGRGEEVDVAVEAPPLSFGNDEIGQVGQAFNAVQQTAIRTAVEQAELRRSVRDVFLSLARRTQALVHRQLTLLDAMERRATDAEELEDLFRVDHLATRMRRNAENLIVLSGSTPGRTWRRNVPMIDVIRGAVAEVEDYARVTVLPIGPVGLAGRAVGDIIHLLAELIENALSFSPPHTTVQVNGQMVANGYVIEVEDRGLGMSEEELADANQRIADHPEFSLSSAARLGLFVVSRLAERHGVRVHLKESPYGGTTAVVLIPTELVTSDTTEDLATGGAEAAPGTAAGAPVALATSTPISRPATAGHATTIVRPGSAEQPTAAGLPAPAPAPVAGESTAGRGTTTGTADGGGSGSTSTTSPTVSSGVPSLPRRTRSRRADTTAPSGGAGPAAADAVPTGTPPNSDLPTGTPPNDSAPGDPVDSEAAERLRAVLNAPTTPLPQHPGAAIPPAAPMGSPPGAGDSTGSGSASPAGATGGAAATRETSGTPAGPASVPSNSNPPPMTPAGLPFRVRQANLAPALRDGSAGEDDDGAARTPDEVRQLMSRYQSGTRQGRTDAARLRDDDGADAVLSPSDT